MIADMCVSVRAILWEECIIAARIPTIRILTHGILRRMEDLQRLLRSAFLEIL